MFAQQQVGHALDRCPVHIRMTHRESSHVTKVGYKGHPRASNDESVITGIWAVEEALPHGARRSHRPARSSASALDARWFGRRTVSDVSAVKVATG